MPVYYSALPPELLATHADTIDNATDTTSLFLDTEVGLEPPAAEDFCVLVAYAGSTVATPGWTIGQSGAALGHLGWQLAGQNYNTPAGSMAVFTRRLTADNTDTILRLDGPPEKAAVMLRYRGCAGLDGAPAFTTGTGDTATTAARTITARADRVLLGFASNAGGTFTAPDGADVRDDVPTGVGYRARYTGLTSLYTFESSLDYGSVFPAADATHSEAGWAWMSLAVPLLPAQIPPPPDPGGAGLDEGIRFSPGAFQPTPVLTINNADVQDTALDPTRPVVLDGFSVTWGRDRLLAQPEPATGTLGVWFASAAAAAAWAASDGLPGQLLELSYNGVLPGEALPSRTVFFRGRISSLKVRAADRRLPDATLVRGAVVDLTLAAVLNDLANMTPREAWPEESMADRLARLQPPIAPYVTVTLRDYWTDAHVAPVDAGSQSSMLDHVAGLFDACGADRMAYRPADQTIAPVLRRSYPGLRGMAGLTRDAAETVGPGRAGQGAYLAALPVYPAGADAAAASARLYLDAAALEYDPGGDGFTLGPDNRISRVEYTNPDATTDPPYGSRTTVTEVPGVNETTHGVRAATVSSTVVWNEWADTTAAEVAALVAGEGQEYTLAPLVWMTRRTGGFETVEQVRLLLAGVETQDLVFLQRSVLPRFGIRPVFGVMGGSIGYSDGGWDLTLVLAPVAPPGVPQHAIAWDEIDDGTEEHTIRLYLDHADHPDGLHASVTAADLGYCAAGLGVAVIPADTGWDT